MNYCKKQDNKFAIVLMSIKRKNGANAVSQHLIDSFLHENTFIINYCQIDLNSEECDFKEPFEIIFNYFLSLEESRLLPTNYIDSNDLNKRNDSFSSNDSLITLKKKSNKKLSFKDLDNDEETADSQNQKCCS